MALVQALVLVLALACAVYLYLVRPDRRWYTGRAVAESIKTITWRYVCRAEPFDDADERIVQHQFAMKLKAIVGQNKDISGLLTTHLDGVQISQEMRRVRAESAPVRLDYYRKHRIVEQQSWYANKASTNRRMVDRFFTTLIVMIAVAIFFSIAKIRFPEAPYWPTDFFVTVAAGILSWIQAKRFQELTASYALAAHEISLIRQLAAGPMEEKELSNFVGDAENAFSREHTQWVARKDN
jgi:hypothetical protein